MTKFIKLFLAVVLLAGCSKQKDTTELTILTEGGKVGYIVEEASTLSELEKGLMFRESLDADTGMIFDLSRVKRIAMWMKDTKIPLDMVFIDKDGTISWVYENAEPNSETLIISPFPAAAVLEINAGDVQRHGIKVGDKVEHKFFGTQPSLDTPESRAADETPVETSETQEAPAPIDQPEEPLTE